MVDLFIKLLFSLYISGVFVFPFSEEKEEKKEAGSTNIVDKNGKKVGRWFYFGKDLPETKYPKENLVLEGQYKDGKREGTWIKYHRDGKTPLFVGAYQNNRPHGSFKKYNEKGSLIESGNFLNGKYNGTLSKFYDSGIPMYEGEFHQGLENGEIRHYDKNGTVELAYTSYDGVVSGNMRRNEILNNEKLKTSAKPANRRIPEGASAEMQEQAPVVANPIVKSGTFNPNGYNKIYNEKDDILQDGVFKGGRLFDGKLYQYDRDGILFKVKIFKNGIYTTDGQI